MEKLVKLRRFRRGESVQTVERGFKVRGTKTAIEERDQI
jgi:hypothetical protein